MKKLWLVIVIGVLASLTAAPAGAATYQCSASGPGNYFAGQTTAANVGRIGAAAAVTVRPSASYCVGHSGNFSSTWVMEAGTPPYQYAQAGFDTALCGAGGCSSLASPHYFTQSMRAAGYGADTWVGPLAPVGTSDIFWAWSDTGCGCAIMAIGLNTYVSSTSWSPFSSWSGSQSQFLSEAADPADHIAGSSSARVDYFNMVELPYLGAWTSSLAPITKVNQSPYLWGVTNAVVCLNGYDCFSSWSNP